MSSTSTAEPAQQPADRGVVTLAARALLHHMHDRNLPLPYSIGFPFPWEDKPLTVHLDDDTHTMWTASVHIDNTTETPSTEPGYTRTVWETRLPDTGHRVTLCCYRRVPFVHGPAALRLAQSVSGVPA